MTVYIVFHHVAYEGSYFDSVWSTQNLADLRVDKLKESRLGLSDYESFDYEAQVVDFMEDE